MKISVISILVVGAALAGCSTPASSSGDTQAIAPTQAILLAADAAPFGVKGTFVFEVRAVGQQDGNIYLNSELDYRDQRNLTVAIFPDAAQEIRRKFGENADLALMGRRIKVKGEAKRVKIAFVVNGVPSDKYYYQTQVFVQTADQVEVVP